MRPGCGAGTIRGHPILQRGTEPTPTMADRRDKPPILRVLVLLVALVSTALALAALSPQRAPEAAPTAPSTVATSPAATTARP